MAAAVIIAFPLLAIAGTLGRILAGNLLDKPSFPFGTLLVNVVGSLALGLLAESTDTLVTVLGVGGLGSLTTYSSLTRETIRRCAARLWWSGSLYLAVSMLAGVSAAWLGIQIVRHWN